VSRGIRVLVGKHGWEWWCRRLEAEVYPLRSTKVEKLSRLGQARARLRNRSVTTPPFFRHRQQPLDIICDSFQDGSFIQQRGSLGSEK
jgi:hypothetical protein